MYQNLGNAPIREALLDIKVEIPPGFDLDRFFTLREKLPHHFSQHEKKFMTQATINLESSGLSFGPDSAARLVGHIFRSSEEKKLVQFRLDGFTYNKLAPYGSWIDFIKEAVAYYELYLSVLGNVRVVRAGLRYINIIEAPLPLDDFCDYIKIAPNIPSGLPQALENYFVRLVVPDDDPSYVTILTSTFEHVANGRVPIVLDIDTFTEDRTCLVGGKIWDAFEKLHYIKNKYFFELVTARTLEMSR